MSKQNESRADMKKRYKEFMDEFQKVQIKKEIDHWCAEIENKYWGRW